LDGGRTVWIKFGKDKFHWPKERGCSAAGSSLVLGEAAVKIAG